MKGSRRFRKYVSLAEAAGGQEARLIPASGVVAAEWVRLKCQYGCGGYGKRLCCPPLTPDPARTAAILREYRTALIYSLQPPRHETRSWRRRTQRSLAELERAAFLDGYYKAFGLGAGPCRLCAVCDPGRPCKHPHLARPAMEAMGIDVYATSRNAGIPLHVATCREDQPKYINLLLIE